MLARYRLFLAVAGMSIAIGLAVALAPIARGHNAYFYYPATYIAATNNPDPIAGFWVAVISYALMVGLILSARALRTK